MQQHSELKGRIEIILGIHEYLSEIIQNSLVSST